MLIPKSGKPHEYTFFYKQHFFKQYQAEIRKKSSNTLRLNFSYLKIIHILHQRYHQKIVDIIYKHGTTIMIKNLNKYVCIYDTIQFILMKMKMKMKNASHRYNLNGPTTMIMLMVEQIFLSPQVKRSTIISNKLVFTSRLTSRRTT